MVSYVPKPGKAVIMLSTMHRDAVVSSREDKKPEIILQYNSAKGGVDTLDQMAGAYSTKRMTRRYVNYKLFNYFYYLNIIKLCH
jgi:hypothetical protein